MFTKWFKRLVASEQKAPENAENTMQNLDEFERKVFTNSILLTLLKEEVGLEKFNALVETAERMEEELLRTKQTS